MGQIFEYPFKAIPPNPALRPVVPILVINPDNPNHPMPILALLDTGADSCLFPDVIPIRTNHNLKGANVETCSNSGIHKNAIQTWKHTFVIKLLSPKGDNFVWESKPTLICCTDHNTIPVLLGTKEFLSNFKILFDYKRKIASIEIP